MDQALTLTTEQARHRWDRAFDLVLSWAAKDDGNETADLGHGDQPETQAGGGNPAPVQGQSAQRGGYHK